MDTESRIVYQVSDADDIINAFKSDKESAKEKYDDNYYILYGDVSSIKSNAKEFVLGTPDGKIKGITCSTSDKELIEIIKSLKDGVHVRVYGKFSVGLNGALNLKINQIEKAGTEVVSDDMYGVIGGPLIKKSNMSNRSLHSGTLTYYIPSNWSSVEHNIKEEGLGNIEGYQYCLNDIKKTDAYAESLFICYFDKSSKNVDPNDKDKNKQIEEAIIRDIVYQDKDHGIKQFPFKDVKTYYGVKYKYYRDQYKTATNEKYTVEMIFQETEEGIAVVVYVYKSENNINDIMVVLRMMEIK